jgi:Flp pilus assembly protein TadB
VTLARLALAFTVAGLVLAGVAGVGQDRLVTWIAIACVSVAVLLRWLVRRAQGSPRDRT